jgi:hypothetical protein
MMYSTERVSKMNVSKQADQTFLHELERTDRSRYDRLLKAMSVHAVRLQRLPQAVEMPVGRRCVHCGLTLPSDIRSDSQYCDAACKKAAYRLAKAA